MACTNWSFTFCAVYVSFQVPGVFEQIQPSCLAYIWSLIDSLLYFNRYISKFTKCVAFQNVAIIQGLKVLIFNKYFQLLKSHHTVTCNLPDVFASRFIVKRDTLISICDIVF